LPELQTSSLPHAVAQSPQWAGSLLVSVQLPLQLASPGGHTQPAAPEQSLLTLQAVVQSPQCAGSLPTSTQLAPHVTRPLLQVPAHKPRSQTSPTAHATPQAPQFAASLARSTQSPLQST